MNIFRLVTFVLNPQKAIDYVSNHSSNKYIVGYINEFFSKYITFGKSKKEIIKINEIIDKKIKTKDKMINTLIELRRIRNSIKQAQDKEQLIKSTKSFGVSSGIVTGTALNITSVKQLIPKKCIGIFPTSGVKYTNQFLKCIGIIFKNGAMTSHGAILAREKSIPALISPYINISDKTVIRINGLTGEIKTVDIVK